MCISFNKYSVIDECYYKATLENGLEVIVFPRKSSYKTIMSASVKFGSGNSAFKLPGDSNIRYIPAGLAHLLEHLLFWKDGKDSFLNDNDIETNGYTADNHTCYTIEFAEPSKFKVNAEKLLDLAFIPSFNENNLNVEKKIVSQECDEDNCSYHTIKRTLTRQAYGCHPNQELYNGYCDAYGTYKNELDKITLDLLLECHDVFYRPQNMLFTIIGDVDLKEVASFMEEYFADKQFKPFIDVSYPAFNLNDEEGQKKSNVIESLGGFEAGIMLKLNTKEYYEHLKNASLRLLSNVTLDLASFLVFSKSGLLNEYLLQEEISLGEFLTEYKLNDAYRHLLVTYFNPVYCYPNITSKMISFLRFIKSKNFSNQKFMWAKKMLYTRMLMSFNSNSELLESLLELYYAGIDFSEYIKCVLSISKEEMKRELSFILDNGSFYTVYSMEKD